MKKVRQKAAEKLYASGIGPDTTQEAREIHRGVYDGFIKIWKPSTYGEKVLSFRETPFKEFEDNDKHYYVSVMTASYISKYVALALGFYLAPKAASLFFK